MFPLDSSTESDLVLVLTGLRRNIHVSNRM